MSMLSEFVTANRQEIVALCRERVASRTVPRPTPLELEEGIPLFLDQLALTLRSKLSAANTADTVGKTATLHGRELLRMGFTVAQVVHDYGDVCQTITELAIKRAATISTVEFQALNLCLDEAIAQAVTEYSRQHDIDLVAERTHQATEDLGYFAHELRNLLATATLAFEALRNGSVGISGSTGSVLGRTLTSLRSLVDSSLVAVRLKAGIGSPERIGVDELVEELEVSALLDARARGHQLVTETRDGNAVVMADRQILASVIANLLQNAYKYSRPNSRIVLRTSATAERVVIEVEDECGGLPPGKARELFEPFEQRGADRSGLGLGLAICVRGAEAIGATLGVRDLPGKGCVFAIELPRASKVN